MPFPAFWANKFALKFILTILVFEIKEGKTAQKINKLLTILIDFVKQGQRIKPKTYCFPFIYLLFFAGLFV